MSPYDKVIVNLPFLKSIISTYVASIPKDKQKKTEISLANALKS